MDFRHVPCPRTLRSAGASTFHLLTVMTHPMLQESWDEAMSCAQIEYDQEQQAQQPAPASNEPTEDAPAF